MSTVTLTQANVSAIGWTLNIALSKSARKHSKCVHQVVSVFVKDFL